MSFIGFCSLQAHWLIIFCALFRDHNNIDVSAVYHQLMATYTSDSDENPQPGTSTGSVTPAGRRRSRRNAAASVNSSGGDWRDKCRQILEIIGNHNDSMPFREPVDTLEHPGKYIFAS